MAKVCDLNLCQTGKMDEVLQLVKFAEPERAKLHQMSRKIPPLHIFTAWHFHSFHSFSVMCNFMHPRDGTIFFLTNYTVSLCGRKRASIHGHEVCVCGRAGCNKTASSVGHRANTRSQYIPYSRHFHPEIFSSLFAGLKFKKRHNSHSKPAALSVYNVEIRLSGSGQGQHTVNAIALWQTLVKTKLK